MKTVRRPRPADATMQVAILFDGVSALAASPDVLILETVEIVENALAEDGHLTVRIPVELDGQWINRLRHGSFDLAFNVCEGIDGVAAYEPAVIAVLELLGIPYTGSSSWTTALCLRKPMVNSLLERAGVPVPRWAVARPGDPLPSVGFPALCKPAAEDASLGVEQRSVVRTRQALTERLAEMHELWPEVMVQRFVDGRELNVGIVGDTVLPIAEIDFTYMPRGMWRIVTYRSKWQPGSDEDLGSVQHCPAAVDAALAHEVSRVAVAAWRAVGGEGYGRVDLRVDRLGRPWVLEVNPNPDINPEAGLAGMGRAAGLDYRALFRLMCDHALARPRVSNTHDRWLRVQALSGLESPEASVSGASPSDPDMRGGAAGRRAQR
jgi:D-alanine-D-alanine ligase